MIGLVERGFDVLGTHFGSEGFTMAARTNEQLSECALRPYEQKLGVASAHSRFGLYPRGWA